VSPKLLIIVGLVLAVVGMVMLWASRPRATRRRRARVPRPVSGRSGALICAAVAGGLITGVQWAVVSQTGPAAAWMVVLGAPAFLAGTTVVRLLAVVGIVVHRHRATRARRERGASR
jgi:hypothetical protein